MSQIQELNKSSFDAVVGGDTPVLVDFWAPWCGPCRMLTPELEAVAQQVGEKVKIAKVNVDDEPELAQAFGVQSIPNLILFKNGEPVRQLVGFRDRRELLAAIG